MQRGDWLVTFSGRRLFVRDPDPMGIVLEDIAAHLSKMCRFNGAVREFYSVAQHSVMVSHLVPAEVAAEALFHDAHEYVLNDLIRPVKREIGGDYAELAALWDGAIARRFGLDRAAMLGEAVRTADMVALVTERRDLLTMPLDRDRWPWREDEAGVQPNAEPIVPLGPSEARAEFIRRFYELNISHRSAA